MAQVIIIMGSEADRDHCKKIKGALDRLGVTSVMRIASAHKVPLKALDIIREYDTGPVVFITVAGRSNALSGFVDANTTRPVIACPPYGEKFSGADLYSSIRMPSGVAPMLVLEPEEAAMAAVKILSMNDQGLAERVSKLQGEKRAEIEGADRRIMNES
ncbi:MAG: AIR carboxylase family protein [Chrysiogenales bacterium]|nr:MAG: AIR carboxylase family protein [Chrysiogenales bacterium]